MLTTASETITDLDTAWDIPCAGQQHVNGTHSHVLGQNASQAAISPCCGFRLLLCEGRANYLQHIADVIHCSSCDHDSKAWLWQFNPISGGTNER